jgi:ABC-type bacteriocin/lantibiotic exporter with double-glycine peptidase domain
VLFENRCFVFSFGRCFHVGLKHAHFFIDGATRIGATLFQELRNAVFATVAQKAIRKVACSVYEHLLRLDLQFHLSRQTGGLTRAIDRGTKGISFLLSSMVFHVAPTILEIGLVCGILVSGELLKNGSFDLMFW